MERIMIGLDIAKNVFQLHGEDARGRVVFCKRLGRAAVSRFLAAQPPALIGIEACGSAHYWARQLTAMGHEVRLIPPAYVKPFVKRNKTDARDAAAICEAMQRPSMRFVAIKSVEQQCMRGLHAARNLLVRQCTQLMNASRALLAEMGIIVAQGLKGFAELVALIEAGDERIPTVLGAALAALVQQKRMADEQIGAIEARILVDARANPVVKRLVAVPGVGWLTAHAVVAAIGEGSQFGSARDFAAWTGLTPRQHSTGEKRRTGHITRAGDKRLRQLFVLGARSVMRQANAKPHNASPWLRAIRGRRPAGVAVVAQAAKTARIVFALLRSGASYRVNHRVEPAAA
jgi:transposase